MSPIDEKVIQQKIDTGKPLDKDEQQHFLAQEGAVEGFVNVEDISQEEFDGEDTKKDQAPTQEKDDQDDGAPAAKATEPVKDQKPAQKEEQPAGQENKRDFFVRLEQELAKEEGKEDLKDFSSREKAYYRQMRLDRKNRQRAEEERDQIKFKAIQLEQENQNLKKTQKPVEEVDPVEELRKRDKTEYLTVAETLALVEKIQTQKPAPTVEPKKDITPAVDPRQMRYLKMCEKEARDAHPEDFDTVLELADEIVTNNVDHLTTIAKAMVAGENPALRTYELIKADPRFAELLPVAQTKIEARQGSNKKPDGQQKINPPQKSAEELAKEAAAKKAEEALEKNQNKTRTTGHVHSNTGTDGDVNLEEIAKMSDAQFAKLPRKTRQKYLEAMKDM